MIKEAAVLIGCTALGAGLWYFLAPTIQPYIPNLMPIGTNLLTEAPTHIHTLVTFAKDNAMTVATCVGGTVAIGGYIANWLHKRGLEKQATQAQLAINEVQTTAITAQNKVLNLETVNQQLTSKISMLEEANKDASSLVERIQGLEKEVETVTAQRNQLANLVPDATTLEEWTVKLEQATKIK